MQNEAESNTEQNGKLQVKKKVKARENSHWQDEGNKGNTRTDVGGDRNKDGRSEADDRNKEGDRNKVGDGNKGTTIKGNSYLLANPRPAEAPDNDTVVHTTGADHSAPGTKPEPNTPYTQTLPSGAIQVVYQVQYPDLVAAVLEQMVEDAPGEGAVGATSLQSEVNEQGLWLGRRHVGLTDSCCSAA